MEITHRCYLYFFKKQNVTVDTAVTVVTTQNVRMSSVLFAPKAPILIAGKFTVVNEENFNASTLINLYIFDQLQEMTMVV